MLMLVIFPSIASYLMVSSVVLARAVSKKFEKISKKYDAYIEKIKTQKPSTKREQILELDKKFEMGKTILIHASEEMESILRRSPVKFDLDSFAKYTKRFLIGVALAEDYHNVKRLEMQADPTAFVSSNLVKLAEDATEAIAKGMALNTASTWMINNAFMEAMAAFAKRLNVGAKDIQEFDKALSKPRELTVGPVDEKKGGIVVGEK